MLTVARVDLGIALDELRGMTPRFFFGLIARLKVVDRPRNYTIELMVAQLIAMVGNTSMAGFKKPLEPKDFMPSQAIKRAGAVASGKRQRKPRMTRKRQTTLAAEMRASFMRFVGK